MPNQTFQPTIGYATIHQTSLKNRLATDNFSVEADMLGIFEDQTALPTVLFGLETDLPESLTPLMQNVELKARYQRQRLDATLNALKTACHFIAAALPLVPEAQVPYSHQVLAGLKNRLNQVEALSQQTNNQLAKTAGIQSAIKLVFHVQQLLQSARSTVQGAFALMKRPITAHQTTLNQLKGIGLLVPYLSRLPHAQASLEAGVWVEVFKSVRQRHQQTITQQKTTAI